MPVRDLSTHPGLDDKRNWGKPGLWHKPSGVDVEYWQRRINDIIGTDEGEPIIRLTWAWEPKEFWFTKWDGAGNGIEGEMRPKYEFLTLPMGDKNYYLCAPRWVLEEREPPAVFQYNWNLARFGVDTSAPGIVNPYTGEEERRTIDLRGDPPNGSGYVFLKYLAEHDADGRCCKDSRGKHPCFGYYREPNEWMLRELGKAKALRDASMLKVDPHRPLAQQQSALEMIAKQTEDARLANEARKDKELTDIFEPFVKTHGWRAFTDSPKELHWGKYKFAYPVVEFTGAKDNDNGRNGNSNTEAGRDTAVSGSGQP